MKALVHIEILRADLEQMQEHLDEFADEHMNESWLDTVWKRLMDAFDTESQTEALDEAQREYERLRFIKENQDD